MRDMVYIKWVHTSNYVQCRIWPWYIESLYHWIQHGICKGRSPHNTRWRHQMETFSALLAICKGNPSISGGFPSQKPVTRSFGVFFYLRLNKRLSKQSRRWWRRHGAHYDVTGMNHPIARPNGWAANWPCYNGTALYCHAVTMVSLGYLYHCWP